MANIRVTPEDLSQQGVDLTKYAEDLAGTLELIHTKIGEIDASWDGLAQTAYYDLYETMKISLDEFPKLVDSLGQATIQSADAFSTVDTELEKKFSEALK